MIIRDRGDREENKKTAAFWGQEEEPMACRDVNLRIEWRTGVTRRRMLWKSADNFKFFWNNLEIEICVEIVKILFEIFNKGSN